MFFSFRLLWFQICLLSFGFHQELFVCLCFTFALPWLIWSCSCSGNVSCCCWCSWHDSLWTHDMIFSCSCPIILTKPTTIHKHNPNTVYVKLNDSFTRTNGNNKPSKLQSFLFQPLWKQPQVLLDVPTCQAFTGHITLPWDEHLF